MQALDTFNTAVVSPIYYVMFTSLTIVASVIMFKVYSSTEQSYLKTLSFSLHKYYLLSSPVNSSPVGISFFKIEIGSI